MRRIFLIALAAVPLCATAAAAQQGSTPMQQGNRVIEFRADVGMSEDTLAFAPELVWSMVPHVFNELGLPATESADSTDHAFLTPYLEVRGQLFGRRNHDFFQCQDNGFGMELADNANMIIAMLMRVVPAGDGRTILRTQVDGHARRRDIATNVVDCASTGVLEKALAEMVTQRLREMPTAAAP
ncbi:hypothetical protein [Longimicrobium sp.]|uniref:hypothetical protein n=1 Tax=Longimicrobium sp. TaxID=2029185 RepID=UPI002C0C562F|nr:hypothetical protein [Longimicrobium sp.]HSU14377.1 hypothetical protein [Longimicrobium sp.]